jgi:Polyketide cyclase / dehydrase and lipid transport
MLSGSCSAEVEVPIQQCWELIMDVERAPQWQRTLESLVAVNRDDRGRVLECDTVSDARITKVHCRVQMIYEEPRALRWTLVQSDDLDAMDGSWVLEELGPSLTRATYSLAVDPGPIGRFARPLERLIRPAVIGHQADEFAKAIATG